MTTTHPRSVERPRGELRTLLGAFWRDPARLGALVPTSRALSRRLSSVVPATGQPVVVELGAGTGPVSLAVRDRLPPAGRQLAVEVDPDLVVHLRRTKPWLDVVEADAAQLRTLLAERGLTRADAVVSTLPWSLFDTGQQRLILDEVAAVLAPTGAFTTVAYLPSLPLAGARLFRRLLHDRFEEVVAGPVVWNNLPPAVTYVCRRSRREPANHA